MTTLYHTTVNGNVPFTEEETEEYLARQAAYLPEYLLEVKQRLNNNAVRLKYDSIDSVISYAGDIDPVYDAEGTAMKGWRSQTYNAAFALITQIEAGKESKMSLEEFVAHLPACPL